MTTAIASKTKTAIARPLPVLVPLIQRELAEGNQAGLEHYKRAGDMLLEAREQVAAFKWSTWLRNNFTLSRNTAYSYMRLAERVREDPDVVTRARQPSIRGIVFPKTARVNARWRGVVNAAKQIDADPFKEARQAHADETRLHRDLAMELIDLGYKALAIKLHPDRGGPRDGMRRLNRVREELTRVAETRRFE